MHNTKHIHFTCAAYGYIITFGLYFVRFSLRNTHYFQERATVTEMSMNSTAAAEIKTAAKAKSGFKAWKAVVFLICFVAFFALFAVPMGLSNMMDTMMNTAYRLLMDTTLYLMAIAVIVGALSAVLTEFGVVELINHVLSPLMRPLYGMPGAAALGIVTTYMSDNPAILTLADDPKYRRYFKAYQIPALTNLGTSFGMGLIVTTFIIGLGTAGGEHVGLAALCGNLGAICGSILATRLMLRHTAKAMSREAEAEPIDPAEQTSEPTEGKGNGLMRFLNAVMDGGKKGVDMGLGIIPGVLVICTIVMMLTNGPSETGAYTGAAYEGIPVLPWIAEKLDFILHPLFGFSSSAGLSVPVTALGSAGAALGLIPGLLQSGMANTNDIAVFTAMCMCWSGYLSTHVSMMELLHSTRFTAKAILYHTISGLFAGVVANWLFKLLMLIV